MVFLTRILVTGFTFGVIIIGCNSGNEKVSQSPTELPAFMQDIENVSVFSLEEQLANADTVELIKEVVFESNEEVFMAGYIREVAIDDQDRVYIVSSVPGTVHVYVFEPDGKFISKFYREGRGPGESETIASMTIKDDKIYLLGSRLQKYLVYSTSDFSFVRDAVIKRDSVTDKKFSLIRASDIYVDNRDRVIMKFRNLALSDTLNQIYYYEVSEEGQLLSDEIFSQEKYEVYAYDVQLQNGGSVTMPWSMPFSRGSQFSISPKGIIHDVWTEHFLISLYDVRGHYLRSIYYPYQKSILDTEKLDIPDDRKKAFEGEEVPNTWPAVHKMMVDENERIWISVITDSESTYQWYVLENTGELKAEFSYPGKRSERNPMFERRLPIVKNGYFYVLERDLSEGIDRIVKYRIEYSSKMKK